MKFGLLETLENTTHILKTFVKGIIVQGVGFGGGPPPNVKKCGLLMLEMLEKL